MSWAAPGLQGVVTGHGSHHHINWSLYLLYLFSFKPFFNRLNDFCCTVQALKPAPAILVLVSSNQGVWCKLLGTALRKQVPEQMGSTKHTICNKALQVFWVELLILNLHRAKPALLCIWQAIRWIVICSAPQDAHRHHWTQHWMSSPM